MTMEGVRARIDLDELNYPALAAELGLEALPYLKTIAAGRDPMLASKAAYLAGMIGGADALPVLETAGQRAEPEVRVAVASVLKHFDEAQVEAMADRLLADGDIGVRKMTIKAVARMRSPKLRTHVQELRQSDPESAIRDLAGKSLER